MPRISCLGLSPDPRGTSRRNEADARSIAWFGQFGTGTAIIHASGRVGAHFRAEAVTGERGAGRDRITFPVAQNDLPVHNPVIMLSRRTMENWFYAAAIAGAFLVGAVLYAWGQPLICTCGYVQFWVGSVFSSGNSQHIADWYTLSHIVHGLLVVVLGRALLPSGSRLIPLAVAIVTGVGWEIVEHTDWVLNRFRAATLYQGYLGDSVLNAVADYLWMLGGFFLGRAFPTVLSLLLIVVLEISAAIFARDSLTLTTITLIFPIDAIEQWQQELNPIIIPDE